LVLVVLLVLVEQVQRVKVLLEALAATLVLGQSIFWGLGQVVKAQQGRLWLLVLAIVRV
jgi:hypothetical protein